MTCPDAGNADSVGPAGRLTPATTGAASTRPTWLQRLRVRLPLPRPMTLAVVASLCVHVGLLMSTAGPASSPTRSGLRRPGGLAAAMSGSMPPITATLDLGRPVVASGPVRAAAPVPLLAPAGLALATTTDPEPHVAPALAGPVAGPDTAAPQPEPEPEPIDPRGDAAAAAAPQLPGPQAHAEPAPPAADPATTPPTFAPPGWGSRRNTWAQAQAQPAWLDGARALALSGQARIAQAQQGAQQDAAQRSRGQYELQWRQRLAGLHLGGACSFTLTGGELPTARCADAADEATLNALGAELGRVPAGGLDGELSLGPQT